MAREVTRVEQAMAIEGQWNTSGLIQAPAATKRQKMNHATKSLVSMGRLSGSVFFMV
jgi:hypothetical protein